MGLEQTRRRMRLRGSGNGSKFGLGRKGMTGGFYFC